MPILVAPLLLNNATKTNSVSTFSFFYIFIIIHLMIIIVIIKRMIIIIIDLISIIMYLMIIVISKWSQNYFKVISIDSSKKYSNCVLEAVFCGRKLSKTLLYVGPENWKSYKVLYQKFSRRPPHIGFGFYEVKNVKLNTLDVEISTIFQKHIKSSFKNTSYIS